MLDCDALKAMAKDVSLVVQCEAVAGGLLRIATVFRYPDGSHIDLFLQEVGHGGLLLSDLGETTAYLFEMGIRPWESRKRRTIILEVCKTLHVQQDGSQFQIVIQQNEVATFGQALLRLAQACIRVSDVAYTTYARFCPDLVRTRRGRLFK